MGILSTLFSTGAGTLIKDIGDTVDKFVTTDKERDALKNALSEAVLTHQEHMADAAAESEKVIIEEATKQQAAVNSTMQAEAKAKADHWPTFTWRPFIGFVFGANLGIATVTVSSIYIAMMFGNTGAAGALANLPSMLGALGAINGTALPILGIASYYRGKMQADPAIPTDNRG